MLGFDPPIPLSCENASGVSESSAYPAWGWFLRSAWSFNFNWFKHTWNPQPQSECITVRTNKIDPRYIPAAGFGFSASVAIEYSPY
jgi:hypothetical protein